MSSDCDRVTAYAEKVSSGEIIAGPHVRAACERHLRDLIEGPERGLFWDYEEAERFFRFCADVLKLNGGEFEGKPFELLDWQAFIMGSLFGWKGDDGHRRFRTGYIETGKGSGKSPMAAAVGLYGLLADKEPRAEVYAAATKKDQAMILFRDAVSMVDQSPLLAKNIRKSGTGQNVWNLAHLKSGSFFRPIAADDSASGPRPHISLLDEVHEHKNRTIVEMLRAGTKGRRQALTLMITNSGTDRTSICRDYHDYGSKVCSGVIENDSFFAYICAVDEGDDPFESEECWGKANPSLGITIPLKYLREQVEEARGMPAKEATVRRLNFCEWVDAGNPWISGGVWRMAGADRDITEFYGRRVYAGLDMASTQDLASLVLLVEPIDTEPWFLIPYFWLPKDNIKKKSEKDRVPYDVWAKEGYLELTEGAAINKKAIVRRIAEITSRFDMQPTGYDRWRIEDLKTLLNDEGIEIEMQDFGQGFKDMAPAVDEFESLLINNNLHHNNNPVMTWCAANAVTEEDPAGNKKLNKQKSTGRIDGMVAGVMAVGVSLSAVKIIPKDSIYSGNNAVGV